MRTIIKIFLMLCLLVLVGCWAICLLGTFELAGSPWMRWYYGLIAILSLALARWLIRAEMVQAS